MRRLLLLVVLAPLMLLAGCGGDEHRTVAVNPQPGQTVVVPPSGNPRVCPYEATC